MFGRRLIFLLVVSLFFIVVATVITIYSADANQTYTILVDDRRFTHKGKPGQVFEILKAAGIATNSSDLISPPLTADLPPGTVISVMRAQKVNLIVDGIEEVHWTHQKNLKHFLAEVKLDWSPTTRIYADNLLVHPEDITDHELTHNVKIENQKTIHILDGSIDATYSTYANTIGELLWENGIEIRYGDGVTPQIGSWLYHDQTITINRANNYLLELDGVEEEWLTRYTKVEDIIADFGVTLSGSDYSVPPLNSEVIAGEIIEIIRVHHQYQAVDETIPYSSSLLPIQDLEIDQRTLVSAGVPGIRRRLSQIVLENGTPIMDNPAGDWLLQPPVDEIVGYGTNIVVRTMETPDGPVEYWRVVSMRATSYTATTSGKPPDHPAYGITASGVPAGTGVVAIDPNIVPFRSRLYVPGYGIAFAGDTGGGVKGRIIDLGYDEGELVSWRGFVDVYYLTPVPPADNINYLLP